MRVITNSPIINEATSNCCGKSSFEGYSNANDMVKKSRKNLFSKDSSETSEKSSKTAKIGSKVADYVSKDSQQKRRDERKTNRLKRKEDRKPKKNARKLVVLDAGGNEMTFYPLSPLVYKNGKWYKKKLVKGSDGKPTFEWKVVDSKNVLKRKNKKGETIAIDKVEVEKASGTTLTNEEALKKIGDLPLPTNPENKQALEESGNSGQGAFVPTDNVVVTGDGNVFLEEDTQDKKEKEKEATETPDMSKTQKTILWAVGIIAVGVIGYAVYRSINKNN